MEYQRDELRVHRIRYHLVWTPKRRKAVLVGALADDCRMLIEQTCTENGWEICELAVRPDHISLLVRVWPGVAADDVVKTIKRRTSPALRARYPDLKKLPSVWTRSYYAATVGDVDLDAVNRYLAARRGK